MTELSEAIRLEHRKERNRQSNRFTRKVQRGGAAGGSFSNIEDADRMQKWKAIITNRSLKHFDDIFDTPSVPAAGAPISDKEIQRFNQQINLFKREDELFQLAFNNIFFI